MDKSGAYRSFLLIAWLENAQESTQEGDQGDSQGDSQEGRELAVGHSTKPTSISGENESTWRFGLEDIRGSQQRRVFVTIEEVLEYVKELIEKKSEQ